MKKLPLKTTACLGLIALLTGVPRAVFSCDLSWLPPQNHFDGVNEYGTVSYWEQIDSVDFGGGLKLPLIIGFRSDRAGTSPYLGTGWSIPLLESRFYAVDDRNYLMIQPDGTNRYFSRQNTTDTIVKDRGGWVAEIKGDTVVAAATCGWTLTFTNGKLSSIITPENRQLTYIYVGDQVSEIQENSNTVLKVITGAMGHAEGLEFNDKQINFDLNGVPVMANKATQPEIAALVGAEALSKISGVSKGDVEFEYAFDKDSQPTLLAKDADGKATHQFAWNGTTGIATSVDGWKYKIKQHTLEKSALLVNAEISRKNAKGAVESWFNDVQKGTATTQNADGTKVIFTRFVSGSLNGKIRHSEVDLNGKPIVARDFRYTEDGHIDLVQDLGGGVYTCEYDSSGRCTKVFYGNETLITRQYNEGGKETDEATIDGNRLHFDYLDNGDRTRTMIRADGTTSTVVFDPKGNFLGSRNPDGSIQPIGLKNQPDSQNRETLTTDDRDATVKNIDDQLNSTNDPLQRASLLLRKAGIYISPRYSPPDPVTALQNYQNIIKDSSVDALTVAEAEDGAHLAATLLQTKDGDDKAISFLGQALEQSGNGLPDDRRKQLTALQDRSFLALLQLYRVDDLDLDKNAYAEVVKKYGSSESRKAQVDELLVEEKAYQGRAIAEY